MTAKAAHPSSVERDGSRRQLMDDSTLEFDQWQVSWLRIVSARIRCPHTLVRRILFLLLLLSSSVPGRDICARRANSTSSLSFLPPLNERKERERERERTFGGQENTQRLSRENDSWLHSWCCAAVRAGSSIGSCSLRL